MDHQSLWLLIFTLSAALCLLFLAFVQQKQSPVTLKVKPLTVLLLLVLVSLSSLWSFPTFSTSEVVGLHLEAFHPSFIVLPLLFLFLSMRMLTPLYSLLLAFCAGLILHYVAHQDLALVLILPALVLALSQSSAWAKHGHRSVFLRSPLLHVLVSLFALLPFVLTIESFVSLLYFQGALAPIVRQSGLIMLSLLPGAMLGGLALQALQIWMPENELLEEEAPAFAEPVAIESALDRIERLKKSDFGAEPEEFANESERALNLALQGLGTSWQQRENLLLDLLGQDFGQLSTEGYQKLVAQILELCLRGEVSVARLLLGSKNEAAVFRRQLQAGAGTNEASYTYLDFKLLEKMGSETRLVLNEVRPEQVFGLQTNVPCPASIIAFRFDRPAEQMALLWFGFEQNHWFSLDDLSFYDRMALETIRILSRQAELLHIKQDRLTLQQAFDLTPDLLFVLDAKGQVLRMNRGAQKLLDANPALSYEKEDGGRVLADWYRDLLNLQKESTSFRLPGGQSCEACLSSTKADVGEEGRVLLFRDKERINELNTQKSEFITSLGQALRSPLIRMGGFTRILKGFSNQSKEQLAYLASIENELEGMLRMIRNLSEIEQLGGAYQVSYRSFELNILVEDVLVLLTPQAKQNGVGLQCEMSDLSNGMSMNADYILIRQALCNLLENAISCSPHDTTVLLTVRKEAGFVSFSVRDSGKGIAPLDQNRVFTPYFQDEKGQMPDLGKSLGLPMVKLIAEKHRGRVRVESELGKGSVLFMDIPLSPLYKLG